MTMNRWTWRAPVLATLLAGAPALAQAARCGPNEVREPDLGFNSLSCADCSFRSESTNGGRLRMSFSGGEPRIGGVRADGPAEGKLRDGDALVAIDGQLITTAEGGRRYSDIDSGDRVRLSVRRGGQVRQVDVVAGSRCRRLPVPPRPPAPPRAPAPPREAVGPTPPRPPAPPRAGGAPAPPRAPAAPGAVRAPAPPRAPASAGRPPAPPRAPAAPAAGRAPTPPRPPTPPRGPAGPVGPRPPAPPAPPAPPPPPDIMPEGWMGFGVSCQHCSIRTENGRTSFSFRDGLTVTRVEENTPAARAGIRGGDRLTHVDGIPLASEAGGNRFGAIRPGQAVRLSFTRGGVARNAVLTAQNRPDAGRGDDPQRLRFSGRTRGGTVEVRGAPANVTTDPRTGEMVIRSADLTVRIQP
ncbi:PDZ domain-containing protein [Longimicrobium terrae]|uniref:Membrane-associated protease RseP (Regulator of RpoE activity) n=1 Tax=Longimicrobium terrae TaxID=1639882 RepID=A0A841GY91_9BACT|nr:PDZ domain-containing protein [Longimicrobium terrae]MBB4636317.1 hypothetical protein [Longimicrobium terrae]MBB6070713.1 membrane-associated protease RseP (regulator of RpoE activity) [Longimicrobium terrae]NNC29693.1 PDZ domain-containing protein [Longimicrobium terrae]